MHLNVQNGISYNAIGQCQIFKFVQVSYIYIDALGPERVPSFLTTQHHHKAQEWAGNVNIKVPG